MGSAHDYEEREWPEDTRINTIAQNGNNGEHYEENKYKHRVGDTGLYIDVYDVIAVFGVNNAACQHAIKKILCTGQRGYKDFDQDISEAIQALERAPDVQRLMGKPNE